MTRRRKHVRVRVRISFNGLRRGDESLAVMDDRLQSWVNAGLVEVIGDGEDQTGPGRAESDNHERDPDGVARGGPAGGEPGEGFGAGGYGSSEEFDQS